MSTWWELTSCSKRSIGPSKTGNETVAATTLDPTGSRPAGRAPWGVLGRRRPPLPLPPMSRVLSGIQPSGELHLGNYLGAVRNWVADQYTDEAYYCIVDLHALTLDIDPETLRARTWDAAIDLLASGLDPDLCTLFVQSQVAEHARLT